MSAGTDGITQQTSDVHAMTFCRESGQKPDAMVQLDRRTVKIAIDEQMVHAHADLQDALVQVPNDVRRSPPQQLQCFMLLEKFASIELVYGFSKFGRRRRGAALGEVGSCQPFEGAREFRMRRAGVGQAQRKGYTAPQMSGRGE